jgi:hypothetical protein
LFLEGGELDKISHEIKIMWRFKLPGITPDNIMSVTYLCESEVEGSIIHDEGIHHMGQVDNEIEQFLFGVGDRKRQGVMGC